MSQDIESACLASEVNEMRSRLDPEGLEALYERCAPMARRRARDLLQDDEEAWDVVQELFERFAAKGFPSVVESLQMAYCYKAVTHACLNRFERSKVRERATPALTSESAPDHGGALIARNLLEKLGPCLDELDKQILIYRCMDGLSQEEIATLLNVWRRTIGRRLERIRQRISDLSELIPAELT